MKASNRMQRMLFRSVVALAVIALVAMVYSASEKPEPAVTLPNPNGYDDFVAAGNMLPFPSIDWGALDIDQLKLTLATNQQALQLCKDRRHSGQVYGDIVDTLAVLSLVHGAGVVGV